MFRKSTNHAGRMTVVQCLSLHLGQVWFLGLKKSNQITFYSIKYLFSINHNYSTYIVSPHYFPPITVALSPTEGPRPQSENRWFTKLIIHNHLYVKKNMKFKPWKWHEFKHVHVSSIIKKRKQYLSLTVMELYIIYFHTKHF